MATTLPTTLLLLLSLLALCTTAHPRGQVDTSTSDEYLRCAKMYCLDLQDFVAGCQESPPKYTDCGCTDTFKSLFQDCIQCYSDMPVEKQEMSDIYDGMCTNTEMDTTGTDSSSTSSTDTGNSKKNKNTNSNKNTGMAGPRGTWLGVVAASGGTVALVMAAM